MTKRYQGFYTTVPRKGALPSLPLLPKAVGEMFTIKAQPNFPEHWKMPNLVGKAGKCTFVRREWTPPYRVIYKLEIEVEGHCDVEGNPSPIHWDFLEGQIEKVEESKR